MSRAETNLAESRGSAVLKLLERAKVPPLPAFYELCYDYVAGVQSLEAIRVGSILEDRREDAKPAGEQLYDEFIQPYETGEAVESAVVRMMERVGALDVMIVESKEASRSQSVSLAGASAELASGRLNKTLMREWVVRLKAANERTREANAKLGGELEVAREEFANTKAEFEKLRRDSLIDPLTGTANRAGLDQALAAAVSDARQRKSPLSLAVVDIDHFKRFNDSYGHQVGDDVLRLVGRALLTTARSRDVVGRMGGDEFLAVLRDAEADNALLAAERIRKAVVDSDLTKFLGAGVLGAITASIGVASFRDGDSVTSLLGRADRSLFKAKQQGRNRVAGEDRLDLAKLSEAQFGISRT